MLKSWLTRSKQALQDKIDDNLSDEDKQKLNQSLNQGRIWLDDVSGKVKDKLTEADRQMLADKLEDSRQWFGEVCDKLSEQLKSGYPTIVGKIGELPVAAALLKNSKATQLFDEKHYFMIPLAGSPTGFALYCLRHLPEGVPEVNDLPKRRVFHFPDGQGEQLLRDSLLETAKASGEQQGPSSLESLADLIDDLDNKLTYGMLFVGGVAALFNPLVGAGIAAKALMPGVGTLLNKFGLRPLGKKMTRMQMEKAAKEAQSQVAQQFSEANTVKLVNPALAKLAAAVGLGDDMKQRVALLDPESLALVGDHWEKLTSDAVWAIYEPVLEDEAQRQACKVDDKVMALLNDILLAGRKAEGTEEGQ